MRTVLHLVVALVCALPATALAQGALRPGARVRVTGADLFEIPGVFRIDAGKIAGGRVVGKDADAVQVLLPNQPNPLTIPRPGRSLTGLALARDGSDLRFTRADHSQTLHIPLKAIGKLEVSDGRPSKRRRVLLGLASGIAACYLATLVAIRSNNSLDFVDEASLIGLASGIGVGAAVTAHFGRERWRQIPSDWVPAGFPP